MYNYSIIRPNIHKNLTIIIYNKLNVPFKLTNYKIKNGESYYVKNISSGRR